MQQRDENQALLPDEPEAGGPSIAQRLILAIAFGVIGFVAWQFMGPASASAGWMTNVEEAMSTAKQQRKPIVLYFTADWCPPCRQFKSEVLSQSKVKDRLQREYIPVMVDLSKRYGPNNQLALELGVRGVPTLIVYNADGREVDTVTGGMPTANFMAFLDRANSKLGR